MKLLVAISGFLFGVFPSVSAFTPALTAIPNKVYSTTKIRSEPTSTDDDEGLDLDLGEMFDM